MDEKLKQLYKDLPNEAEQRTKGEKTGKKYDTAGYGYQWCVDVLNDTYGLLWGYEWEIIDTKTGTYSTGTPFINITVKVGIWVEQRGTIRWLCGGHTAKTFDDALKGAITNGFKKTAAMFGVGSKAYRGQMDDDNLPQDEINNYNKGHKIDFLEVQKELEECKNQDEINNYSKLLLQEYPNMTDKQREVIKNKFKQRRSELEKTQNKVQKEFQGELVKDDSQIPI